jgi:hypothetical protein
MGSKAEKLEEIFPSSFKSRSVQRRAVLPNTFCQFFPPLVYVCELTCDPRSRKDQTERKAGHYQWHAYFIIVIWNGDEKWNLHACGFRLHYADERFDEWHNADKRDLCARFSTLLTNYKYALPLNWITVVHLHDNRSLYLLTVIELKCSQRTLGKE